MNGIKEVQIECAKVMLYYFKNVIQAASDVCLLE
jgi:hypothetical protein